MRRYRKWTGAPGAHPAAPVHLRRDPDVFHDQEDEAGG